jgi:uncharacterized protein YndB with AHSA1/START domain
VADPLDMAIRTSEDEVRLEGVFKAVEPTTLFDYWTVPGFLTRWWPPKADLEPRRGGRYHFVWPDQGWHLRGTFTEFERGSKLGFTWSWDHDADDKTRVRIRFAGTPDGRSTGLILTHDGHSRIGRSQELLKDHIDGWKFFLPRLARLVDST